MSKMHDREEKHDLRVRVATVRIHIFSILSRWNLLSGYFQEKSSEWCEYIVHIDEFTTVGTVMR